MRNKKIITDEESKDSEGKTEIIETSISVDSFCDLKGIGKVDRMALKRHYPNDMATMSEWIEELSDKIVLK